MAERELMRLARQDDDLRSEPSLDEALADPVIQAVMGRDGVTRDDVMRVALAARARLMVRRDGGDCRISHQRGCRGDRAALSPAPIALAVPPPPRPPCAPPSSGRP